MPTPCLAYVPRDASSIPTSADFSTHRKKETQPSPYRSLPPPLPCVAPPRAPPTAASPCPFPPHRHARGRGWRRRARLQRDGPPPTSQAERSRPPPENAHAHVRCRTTPADATADVAPSTHRTDLGATCPGQRTDAGSRKPSLGTWSRGGGGGRWALHGRFAVGYGGNNSASTVLPDIRSLD
ncbi:hypothetical protein PVAP13_1NG162800 [Panicum virgatum]|uniref:Uncharacterized protein n=1 Tax=Panicum virgatum TaxID=38727 RepID=A0A8T0WUS4_PANVG|nr:hypothetical protein PVAP13_1NG162800 [Panicum virgatum]